MAARSSGRPSGVDRGRGLRWRQRWPWLVVVAILAVVASRLPSSMLGSTHAPRRHATPLPLSPDSDRLPTESTALARASAQVPRHFVRHESARFVALSDGSTAWVREQLERFERAHHQFERFLRHLGMPAPRLRHKLVAILFADHAEFIAFARETDGVEDPWVKGYYLPAADRMVGYDAETDPQVLAGRERLEQGQREIETRARLAEQSRRGGRVADPNLSANLDRARSVQALREEELIRNSRQLVIATMIHEAIHHLMFHTRVQNPAVQYPFWLAEGLAVGFETDQPAAAFGPDFDYRPRREVFERLLMEERLVPLAAFIRFERLPDRRESTARVFYHQSGALLCYLFRQRPSELRNFLERLAAEPPGRVGPQRQGALFEASFGDPESLERSWLRWELGRIAHEDARDRRRALDGPELRLPPETLVDRGRWGGIAPSLPELDGFEIAPPPPHSPPEPDDRTPRSAERITPDRDRNGPAPDSA
jgi:hypothetical protein